MTTPFCQGILLIFIAIGCYILGHYMPDVMKQLDTIATLMIGFGASHLKSNPTMAAIEPPINPKEK